jgi:sodium/proline symporter
MSKAGALDILTGSNSETIIVKIAHLLSTHGVIAAIAAGVILAGILAATMSTADSQLLAAASGISQNLVRECMGVKLSEKAALIVARITVVIISIVAVFMAGNPDSSVFEIVSFAWAGFGATFGPVVLLSLFWRRANKYGAISGMISGGIMIFLWKYVISGFGGVFAIYELLPAFIVAIIVNVVVSLLTKAPSKEVLDKYDEVRAIEINA